MKNSKRRDVLFLCQFFYPEYVSSATLPFDTAVGLANAGYKVSALCGYPKEYCDVEKVPRKEEVQGVSITRLKYVQARRGKFWGRLINYFSFFLSVLFHIRIIGKHKVTVVYTNPPILPLLVVLAKKIMGSKLVFVSYDVYPEMMIKCGMSTTNGMLVKTMNYVNKQVFQNIDYVVCVCADMKQYLIQNRSIDSDKVVVIPNWFEDSKKEMDGKENTNSFLKKYCGKMVVSYFGNMGVCQDIDTILEAVRILRDQRDIQFLFAGHGSKIEFLEKVVAEEKLENVDVYGFLKGKDYTDALQASDCAIVSLVSGLSGLCSPSKICGYLMEGLPIVAIMEDSEIANDLIEYNAGIVIGNGESELLVNKLLELKQDEVMKKAMGDNSRSLFKAKYEKTVCLELYVQLMNSLIKNG